jgi:hypothetical protein
MGDLGLRFEFGGLRVKDVQLLVAPTETKVSVPKGFILSALTKITPTSYLILTTY